MKTVTIRRSRWLRGTNTWLPEDMDYLSNGNSLWDSDMNAGCCLGHVCKQISRKTEDKLNFEQNPYEVFNTASVLTEVKNRRWGKEVVNNKLANQAISINDAVSYSDTKRERLLIRLFRKHDIKLVFVD